MNLTFPKDFLFGAMTAYDTLAEQNVVIFR